MTRPVASLPGFVAAPSHGPAPMAHDQASVLHRHLQQCAKARGRWFDVALLGESLRGLIAPRLATTVALGGLMVGLVLHWL